MEYVCGTKLGETGRLEELQMRWSICIRPNIRANTHTHKHTHARTRTHTHMYTDPADETIMPPNILISQGGITVWVVGEGRRRAADEEGRAGGGLMENGVVSQLIEDALPGLQCLLLPSWLPDATIN